MVQYNDGKVNKQSKKSKKRVAKLPPKTAKAVSAMIDQKLTVSLEKKHVGGSNLTTVQDAAAPFYLNFTNNVQGITENTRIGNELTPTYCGLRYVLEGVSAAAQRTCRVRIVLVQFKPNTLDSGPPIWTEFLQSSANPFTFRHTDFTRQYKVLYDAKHVIVNDSANEAYTVYGEIDVSKGLKTVSYNDGLVTGENEVYLMAISDYSNADAAYPTMQYDWRMYYTDA